MTRRLPVFSLYSILTTTALAEDEASHPAPDDFDGLQQRYPQHTKWIDVARKTPTTYSGTVFLDGKPVAGIRLTDGVQYVETDRDGRYTIDVEPYEFIPYLPSRTISVSWPSGTWPKANRPVTGKGVWWERLMDVKGADALDFHLVGRPKKKTPVSIAFMTDPHDSLTRPFNKIPFQEVERAGADVDFFVLGGDMGYIGMANADEEYAKIWNTVKNSPRPYFAIVGNHDVDYPKYREPHELASDGAFTKYLGPSHWSFDIDGVHVMSLQYSNVGEDDWKWMHRDLSGIPPNTPVYLFTHMWVPGLDKMCLRYPNICLVQAGHSHRTLYCGNVGNAEWWTFMCYYRLIYIEGQEFDFVDRCINFGGRTGGWGHLLNCFHRHFFDTDGPHRGATDAKLTDSAGRLEPPGEIDRYAMKMIAKSTGTVPAKRFGLKITNERGYVFKVYYDIASKTLNLFGRETYFVPELVPAMLEKLKKQGPIEEESWIEFRVVVSPDRTRVNVNNRVSHWTFQRIGKVQSVEYFAEGGEATFAQVDIWEGGREAHWNKYKRPLQNHLP